jgi:hypothetical protein
LKFSVFSILFRCPVVSSPWSLCFCAFGFPNFQI